MNIPNHIAIILDGNGRWAKKRAMPRNYGHYQGGKNLFKIADAANTLKVKQLTVFAFSTENWKRPKEEIDFLMQTPIDEYKKNKDKLNDINYKINFIGRRDRLNKELILIMDEITNKTKNNDGLTLTIAIDYGSMDEIVDAVNKIEDFVTIEKINQNLYMKTSVDLLIRTSGEMRISNFLLWQISYAELYFCKKHWPSFTKRDLEKAIKEYNRRNRRFGGL